jgi:hypothetical protein
VAPASRKGTASAKVRAASMTANMHLSAAMTAGMVSALMALSER